MPTSATRATTSAARRGAPARGAPESRARATRAQRPHALALAIQHGEGAPKCPVSRPRLRRWVGAALQTDARITLRFVGTREGRELNRAYRHKDYATNVLTFAYEDASVPCAADIVICLPVVRREARRQHKAFEHHLAHLVIHGVLHARGFGHDDDTEAAAMEALETALLRRFRIGDPYRPSERQA